MRSVGLALLGWLLDLTDDPESAIDETGSGSMSIRNSRQEP